MSKIIKSKLIGTGRFITFVSVAVLVSMSSFAINEYITKPFTGVNGSIHGECDSISADRTS